jgi:hypothetical protein
MRFRLSFEGSFEAAYPSPIMQEDYERRLVEIYNELEFLDRVPDLLNKRGALESSAVPRSYEGSFNIDATIDARDLNEGVAMGWQYILQAIEEAGGKPGYWRANTLKVEFEGGLMFDGTLRRNRDADA